MDKLIQSGLYGAGLLEIRTPELVSRYNECLEAVGAARTGLHKFSIDGSGWSPEIAQEKLERNYLSANDASRVAIIISPDQHNRPLYYAMYSFEREIMNRLFEQYAEEIADVTADAALWVELEQGLSDYRSPRDLLLIDEIRVRTHVLGGLVEHAHAQSALCRRFTNESEAWFNADLRAAIIATAQQHGDLRSRRVQVPEFVFAETQNFYTRALGGVFVFRGLKKRGNIIICEDVVQAAPIRNQLTEVFALSNPAWLHALAEEQLILIDADYYAHHPDLLNHIHDCLFADAVSGEDKEFDFDGLTPPQRKALIRKHKKAFPAEFFELERLSKMLNQPGFIRHEELSPQLQLLLYHPNEKLPRATQGVLWQLLCKICPVDAVRLFFSDKAEFYEQYAEWPESKKRWAISMIQQQIKPAGNKAGGATWQRT